MSLTYWKLYLGLPMKEEEKMQEMTVLPRLELSLEIARRTVQAAVPLVCTPLSLAVSFWNFRRQPFSWLQLHRNMSEAYRALYLTGVILVPGMSCAWLNNRAITHRTLDTILTGIRPNYDKYWYHNRAFEASLVVGWLIARHYAIRHYFTMGVCWTIAAVILIAASPEIWVPFYKDFKLCNEELTFTVV